MINSPFPQALQDAQIELETVKWFWESAEEQVPMLIDATIHRIAERDYPFWEDNEEAILQRDRVEADMRRIARSTAILQAWIIFEDAACWAAEELRRQGQSIGKKRSGESFITWAERELAFCAKSPFRDEILEWMEPLCRLRNAIVHTNGQYTRLKEGEIDKINHWIAGQKFPLLLLRDGRIEMTEGFVRAIFMTVSMAIGVLSDPFREPHE
jgi:hypothetical protein